MTSIPAVILSCEHAGNEVPDALRPHFAGAEVVLQSHRGWDPGTLGLGEQLAPLLQAPLFVTRTTRLVVDCNRHETNPDVFSAWTAPLPAPERAGLIATHHQPHRRRVEQAARAALAAHGTVLHLSLHSFTPELNGVVRTADVGLLYDPARGAEAEFCARWAAGIAGEFVCRMNYPYLGTDDGLTTWLRGELGPGYAGIELELNHGSFFTDRARWNRLVDATVAGLLQVLRPR